MNAAPPRPGGPDDGTALLAPSPERQRVRVELQWQPVKRARRVPTVPFTHPPRPATRPERALRTPSAPIRRRSWNLRPQALALIMVLVAAFAMLAASAEAFDMAIVLAVGISMQFLCLWTCARDRRVR
ncbi:hypothetical protein [Crossiella sp. CA198]|uniref:hypothetical protein n=1 Tax=Crossiella sp. CA198 TaxID=3455607 RepID=UPI003F8D1AEA